MILLNALGSKNRVEEVDLAKIEEVISECSNEYGINLEIVE